MKKSHSTSARARSALTRGVVTATAPASAGGMVALLAAVAAPPGAVAEAAGTGTTDKQRVDAAAVVRLEPSADVLLLSDQDFVLALWQRARESVQPATAA